MKPSRLQNRERHATWSQHQIANHDAVCVVTQMTTVRAAGSRGRSMG